MKRLLPLQDNSQKYKRGSKNAWRAFRKDASVLQELYFRATALAYLRGTKDLRKKRLTRF